MIKSSKEKKQSSDYIPINLILISCSVTDEKMEKPKMEVVNVVFFFCFFPGIFPHTGFTIISSLLFANGTRGGLASYIL